MLLVLCPSFAAARQEPRRIPDTDRIRLAEAFRIAERLGNRVWSGWSKAPFAVALITPEYEFLVRHPNPPADFKRLGTDPLLASEVYVRKRVFQMELLASFPLNGVATIIIGQAENTDAKGSTPWVITLLHEHFHQLQYSQPGYYSQVAGLGLARGDETGKWMLDFPFPYKDPEVGSAFSTLCRALAEALDSRGTRQFPKKLSAYIESRKSFVGRLAPDDYKYYSFQLWQEGAARYTEHRIAQLAASQYAPTEAFRSMRDFTPFKEVADSILRRIESHLRTISLGQQQRVAFYAVGAAEAMLADLGRSKWQQRYFKEKFSTERYFTGH